MKLLGLMLFICGAAFAQDCPTERPHKRKELLPYAFCTLRACAGQLKCDGDTCFRSASKDCNTCTQEYRYICLSDEELEKAQR